MLDYTIKLLNLWRRQIKTNLKPKKIYLIRHGQTEFNNKGVVQGRGIDASLNALGRKQADAFYQQYKRIKFDKIYTSSLQRSIQTVAAFAEDGIPVENLPGLDEISWGISEGMQYGEADNKRYYGIINEWKEGNLDLKIKNGESPLEVQKRQEEAINHILANTEEETILICMHGRAMRILLSWITNTDLSRMDEFEHDNTSLYILTYENNTFNLDVRCDTNHLKDLHEYRKA